MKEENFQMLQNLSKTCHNAGLLPIFLGLLVGFIGVIQNDATSILTGILIFILGYSLVKIASKISKVLVSEK